MSQLIGEIYEAALDRGRWAAVLGRIAACHQAQAGTLVIADYLNPERTLLETFNVDPDVHKEFARRRDLEDFWCLAAEHDRGGTVRIGTELISRREMHRHGYYHEILVPGDTEWMIGGTIERADYREATFAILRSRRAENFGSPDRRSIELIMTHLRRAYLIHSRLADSELRQNRLEQVINRVAHGIVLLDRNCRVRLTNREADRILRERDGISVRGSRIRLSDGSQHTRFERALGRALDLTKGQVSPASKALRADRPSMRLPYQILILPLSPRTASQAGLKSAPACAVLVSDPSSVVELRSEILTSFFQLTPAQARICEALQKEQSLAAAAASLGISRNTAKTHVRQVFEKCGVHSQAELFALLSGSLSASD